MRSAEPAAAPLGLVAPPSRGRCYAVLDDQKTAGETPAPPKIPSCRKNLSMPASVGKVKQKARSENTERAFCLNLAFVDLLRSRLLFLCLFLDGFRLGGL